MTNLLFDIVANQFVKIIDVAKDDILKNLECPPEAHMGDVAFPCFVLSKKLKNSPIAIANELKDKIINLNDDCFEKIDVVNGYLNFFINRKHVLNKFLKLYENNLLLGEKKHINEKALIEHTSINPNASPHIGRARNAMIGDASARLLKFLGYDTTVHYFVNDIGKQIALLVYYTEGKSNITFNDLLNLYVSANEELKENPEIEEKVFLLLHEMENGNLQVFDKFSNIVNICINGQKNIFNEFGIYYDVYDYESNYIYSGRTAEILNQLEKTKYMFTDEAGRKVLNLQDFNINSENPYFPLTRKDLTSLYPLRDVCYSIDKSIWANGGKNIVVLGEDQKLYGKQVNAVLDILGYKGAEIINYSFVLLADGKMSTRAGKVVLLEDLMKETTDFAKQKMIERGSVVDEKLAKQIAYGAIKYAILKCGNDRNVIFDKDQALSFEGNTSVYIQYSRARILSILKGESCEINCVDFSLLNTDIEWALVVQILSFNSVISQLENTFNFNSLCNYLYDLCKLFSRWYNSCPIKTAEINLKNARLKMAEIIAKNIEIGLNILGIESPEKI